MMTKPILSERAAIDEGLIDLWLEELAYYGSYSSFADDEEDDLDDDWRYYDSNDDFDDDFEDDWYELDHRDDYLYGDDRIKSEAEDYFENKMDAYYGLVRRGDWYETCDGSLSCICRSCC